MMNIHSGSISPPTVPGTSITLFNNCTIDMINKVGSLLQYKQEDPLRSYSLVFAIVCLFVLIIVLKFVGNE